MSEDQPKQKIPARPNSQWATGKRRNLDRKPEPKGYARGARTKQG